MLTRALVIAFFRCVNRRRHRNARVGKRIHRIDRPGKRPEYAVLPISGRGSVINAAPESITLPRQIRLRRKREQRNALEVIEYVMAIRRRRARDHVTRDAETAR